MISYVGSNCQSDDRFEYAIEKRRLDDITAWLALVVTGYSCGHCILGTVPRIHIKPHIHTPHTSASPYFLNTSTLLIKYLSD